MCVWVCVCVCAYVRVCVCVCVRACGCVADLGGDGAVECLAGLICDPGEGREGAGWVLGALWGEF